jgi:surface carbohydrate biosynthesis protein (TIGR04326 family)
MLTLWDSAAEPSERAGLLYTWNGYVEKNSIHSLRRYVELHAEQLRRKYLEFICDLGEVEVEGKQLKAHLDVGDGLSLWWMSLLAEKSFWKSPNIDIVIRLIAIEEIVLKQKPEKILLVGGNQSLHEVLSEFCQNLGIAYEWKQLPRSSLRKLNLETFYRALPHLIQALFFLARHICIRWPLRRPGKSAWFEGPESLFFCSYFAQLKLHGDAGGQFDSRYWGGLYDLMKELRLSGNWLQHYYPHDAVASPQVALDLLQRFNQHRQVRDFHSFLDAYLSWSVVLSVLKRWFKLTRISHHLCDLKNACRLKGSRMSLWPLMQEDWKASVSGRIAIENLLWIELFDRALRDIPYQKKGFYLCENIAWERALIHAWRKHGHGELVAVAHQAFRFWDIRCLHDPRTTQSLGPYPMPQPDLTVLNGRAAIEAYAMMGYSQEAITEGEALRNGYLHDLRVCTSSRKENRDVIKVLILGDFSPSGSREMLKLLEASVLHASVLASYVVKPHPFDRVELSDHPSLNLKLTMEPLEKILGNFDIAFCANLTSAAVDAYLAGLRVVVMLNETELNFSPLRGQSDVCFVSTSEELAEALQMARKITVRPDNNDFFFLDPELPRWRKLLAPISSA